MVPPLTATPAIPTPARSSTCRTDGASLLLQRSLRPSRHTIKLDQLLSAIPFQVAQGDKRIEVTALCTDSRRALPGCVFFARQGKKHNGNDYVEDAIHRGAVAIVTEHKIWAPRKATVIEVDNLPLALAAACSSFYDHPQLGLELWGITGTAGKTVTAYLARLMLGQNPNLIGLLGTNQYILGMRTLPAYRTTPEPTDLYAMFAQMRNSGCEKVVMEVSSHGIDQGRVLGLRMKTAVFLNLSAEHLDYHGDMESYYLTKRRIFDGTNGPTPENAVIHLDDAYGERLLRELPPSVRVVTFGFSKAADIQALDVEYTERQTRFTLQWPSGKIRVVSPLLGAFNLSNLLAAFAIAYTHGCDLETLPGKLIDFDGIRGRMERVDLGQPFSVVIDYAHTAESYNKGLAMLRSLSKGKLVTVFGCGGQRDRARRPEIVRAVAAHSDAMILTADNPRAEDPEQIFADMRQGLSAEDDACFIADRRRAISIALDAARPGDTVLVAGKGHETFQEFADSVVPFDDRAVIRELLQRKSMLH